MKIAVSALALVALSSPAFAQRTLNFQSKADRFELTINGGRGEIAGRPADLSSLQDLLPLLNKNLPDTCPAFKGGPDLTVKDGEKSRSVYTDEAIVTDGKSCITINGEGVYYFPVHRDFLVGPRQDGIKLKSPFKVFKDGQKIFELRKEGDGWVSDSPNVMLDWDFINRLQNSIEKYSIRLRAQMGLGKDKPKMIIQNGGETLEFYKVTNIMWAMKKPGTQWLVASDDWSFFRDFAPADFEDRFAEDIRAVLNATDKEAKQSALGKVETGWSRNLREMYHKLALDEKEDPVIRTSAIRRLKSKPALETAGVMVKILEESTDDDLRDEAAVVLKLNNPKGPKWKSSGTPDERQKALDYWRSWWRQKKSAP